MSAGIVPDSPAMKALHRATWFLVHEADARAAAGDVEASQSFYAAIPFLAEVRKELTAPVGQVVTISCSRNCIETGWCDKNCPPLEADPDLPFQPKMAALDAASTLPTRLRAMAAISRFKPVQFTDESRWLLREAAYHLAAAAESAAILAELRKMFGVPDGHDLLVHAKAVADQWMAVGAPAPAKDATLEQLKSLGGHFQDGSTETITISPDDATRTWHVSVGRKHRGYGHTIADALAAAVNQEKARG